MQASAIPKIRMGPKYFINSTRDCDHAHFER